MQRRLTRRQGARLSRNFHPGQAVAITSQSARGQETITRAAVARVLSTCVVLTDCEVMATAWPGWKLRESVAGHQVLSVCFRSARCLSSSRLTTTRIQSVGCRSFLTASSTMA